MFSCIFYHFSQISAFIATKFLVCKGSYIFIKSFFTQQAVNLIQIQYNFIDLKEWRNSNALITADQTNLTIWPMRLFKFQIKCFFFFKSNPNQLFGCQIKSNLQITRNWFDANISFGKYFSLVICATTLGTVGWHQGCINNTRIPNTYHFIVKT